MSCLEREKQEKKARLARKYILGIILLLIILTFILIFSFNLALKCYVINLFLSSKPYRKLSKVLILKEIAGNSVA